MVKKIQIWILAVALVLGNVANAWCMQVIDRNAHRKILDYLLIEDSDISLYKKIFREIAKANFEKADNLIEKLDNHILLGSVLAEKYLHPKYKSTLDELKIWLNKYAGHQQAIRIYKLAVRKNKGSEEGIQVPETIGSDFFEKRTFDNATKKYLQQQVTAFKKAIRKNSKKFIG